MMIIIKPFLVGTEFMTADIFTKAVDEETFHRCKHEMRNTTRAGYVTRKINKLKAALSRATGQR